MIMRIFSLLKEHLIIIEYMTIINWSRSGKIHIKKALGIHCKNSVFGGLSLKEYIEERAVEIASYIIETKATVRQTAKKFGVSKSTVHKDVTERLAQINPSLASQAREVLDVNKQERHIRGGMATREKYLRLENS
jgi:putative DeoR family transcriptional regulator (stage III sporulation protein D)